MRLGAQGQPDYIADLLRKTGNMGAQGGERKRADFKTEVNFIGQIIGGEKFNTHHEIFCEVSLETGKDWDLLSPKIEIQTQASSAQVILIIFL